MGRQIGTVRIAGTVGNLTFSKTENGEEVRLKSSLNGDKMRTDKRFIRTRENWAEFARAGKAAKLIRSAFSLSIKQISDPRGYSRLVKETLKVVKSDPTSARGEREFTLGDLNILANFEFNVRQAMKSTFQEQFEIAIDRAAGSVEVAFPELVPDVAIAELIGATHFKIVAAAADVNWETEKYTYNAANSAELVYGSQTEPAQTLSLTIPAATTNTILVAIGIFFYQEVNGTYYHMKDGNRGAMALVGIDHV